MHELAVTQSILDIALKNAEKVSAKRITGINLVIGRLASVVDDSIQFYWDILSDGTIAKGAQLNFTRMRTEMCCLDCGNIFTPGEDTFACPVCEGNRVRVSQGDELRIESIDVE
jgi:hydrogenase nickel incorporation protein HypA/HybF